MTAATSVDDNSYKWKAFGAVGLFFVTAVLAFAMVFLALPSIAEEFGVSLASASWVVIVHALTISALLLPMGRLADLIGRRRIHLLGLTVFGIGALLVALSPTFGTLIAARVVMAVGDAMAQSVGTGILVSAFPPHERGKAIGLQTTSVAVGAAAAPIFTGLILEVLPWRALFALLLIPVALSLIAGVVFLDEERLSGATPRVRTPFDPVGAVLSVAAVVLLVVVINNPFGIVWVSLPTLVMGVVSMALFAAFVRWELATEAPMLELRFFTNSVFALGVAARFVGFMASTTIYILLPVFLVSFRQMSEAKAGLVLFLNSVGLGVAAQVAGRLSDRFGTRPFMLVGYAAMAATSLGFAAMGGGSALWLIALISLLNGLAVGAWNVPNNATIIGSVSSASYGVVGAFTNLTRNVGNVFGQAVVAAVVTGVMLSRGFDVPLDEIGAVAGSGAAFVDGWRAAFTVSAVFSVIGLGLAVVIRPRNAEV